MQTIYKVFLIIFIIIIGIILYSFDWESGIMHEANTKYILSLAAAIVGILAVFVLNTWSKIGSKKP